VLQEMVLNGTVRVRPMGSTVWWLDEELQQHWRALDGEALPKFKCVARPGIWVELGREIGEYTITSTPSDKDQL